MTERRRIFCRRFVRIALVVCVAAALVYAQTYVVFGDGDTISRCTTLVAGYGWPSAGIMRRQRCWPTSASGYQGDWNVENKYWPNVPGLLLNTAVAITLLLSTWTTCRFVAQRRRPYWQLTISEMLQCIGAVGMTLALYLNESGISDCLGHTGSVARFPPHAFLGVTHWCILLPIAFALICTALTIVRLALRSCTLILGLVVSFRP